jgi:hypothetical protein
MDNLSDRCSDWVHEAGCNCFTDNPLGVKNAKAGPVDWDPINITSVNELGAEHCSLNSHGTFTDEN